MQQVWTGWLTAEARQAGRPSPMPIDVELANALQPAASSRDLPNVPGLMALIIDADRRPADRAGGGSARNGSAAPWRRLTVTRVTIREIMLAKLLPYFALGMGGMAATGGDSQ